MLRSMSPRQRGSAGVSAFGDHGFGKGQGPREFIHGYNSDGRGVKMFVLKTTPAQDIKMIDFMKANVDGGIDKSKSIVSQNCTTACENVMRFGGLVGNGDNPGGNFSTLFFDSPKALEKSLTSGALSSQVSLVVDLPAEDETKAEEQKRKEPEPQ